MMGLVRILFLVMVVMAVLALVKGIASASRPAPRAGPREGGRGRRATRRGGKLFRDPVCGTYVTAEGSPAAARGRETVYFCSDECLSKFRDSAD